MFRATASTEEVIKALERLNSASVSSRDVLDALDLRSDVKIEEETVSAPANDNARFSKVYLELKRVIREKGLSLTDHFKKVEPPKEEPPKPDDWEYYNR